MPVSPIIPSPDVPEAKPRIDPFDEPPTPTPPTPDTGVDAISSILERIKFITGVSKKPAEVRTDPAPVTTTTLVNHSPGTSPTQSMNTLTSSLGTTTIVEPKPEPEPPHPPIDIREPEPSHRPIDIPVPPPSASPTEAKKCPVCNFIFPSTCDDVAMYDHIEKCLFPTEANVEVKDYECPNCNGKFPAHNDAAYLQHLSDCYNQDA